MPNDDADKLAVDTELTMVFIQDRALLYRIAYDILKDGAIAEEAVQDAYLKVYERSNRGDVHNARAYCAQTVRNTALDIQRRMMKQRASTSAWTWSRTPRSCPRRRAARRTGPTCGKCLPR